MEEIKGMTIEVHGGIEADFCVIMDGSSMKNARILAGDYVLCKEWDKQIHTGKVYVIEVNDTLRLARAFVDESVIVFTFDHPRFTPFIFTVCEMDKFKILGEAVAFQSKIR